MRRVLTVCALATMLVSVAAAAPTGPGTVAAVTWQGGGAMLSLRDEITLERRGRAVRFANAPEVWATGPTGGLALVSSRTGLTVLDRRLRITWRLPRGVLAHALAWVAPRRLLLVEHGAVVLVDPVARRILGRGDYEGQVLETARWARGVVILASRGDGSISPARLMVVGPGARVRQVELSAIGAGVDGGENNEGPFQTAYPGLAVDPEAGQAYVAGAEQVVQVDLATLALSSLADRRSLQKTASGPWRTAAWLGEGTLAVAGSDSSVRRASDGSEVRIETPYGLRYVHDGTVRLVDARAADVVAAAGLALAYGAVSSEDRTEGSGLAAYDAAGRLRWRQFDNTAVRSVTVHEGRAYALTDGRLYVVDVASGRVLAQGPSTLAVLG